MDLTRLIQHPETMDKETLYDLRSLLALHPYYQTARLLMLQNLYLLHDPSFDEELRRAAIYLTDRKVLFNLIEAAHYQLKRTDRQNRNTQNQPADDDRTISLIDNFLETIPADEEENGKKRKPTPADAAVDYVAYLMEVENSGEQKRESPSLHLKGQELIDSFIEKNGDGRIQLNDTPEYLPELQEDNENAEPDEGFFTETLAKIYVKQGRYEQALEIIRWTHRSCVLVDGGNRADPRIKRRRLGVQLLIFKRHHGRQKNDRLHRKSHLGPGHRHGRTERGMRLCGSTRKQQPERVGENCHGDTDHQPEQHAGVRNKPATSSGDRRTGYTRRTAGTSSPESSSDTGKVENRHVAFIQERFDKLALTDC